MLISKEINQEVELLHFVNADKMEVILSPLGASIYAIVIDGKYMTLTPSDMSIWSKGNIYHGKTIGRVGNRIKGNKVICEGKEYKVENNEGENTLHGGLHGLSTQTFDYTFIQNDEFTEVTFTYLSKDGESGFPGELNVTVIYKIYEHKNNVDLTLLAKSNKNTLCSLTNHSYFKLGEENEDTLTLLIKGNRYIIPDEKTLIGQGIGVAPDYLDFSKGRVIGKDVNLPILVNTAMRGYDHHYFFDKIDIKEPQIVLTGNHYELEIYTDYSGAQLYSDNAVDGNSYFDTVSPNHRGAALEPQESHLELHYLNPSDTYEHHINYVFKRR